MPAHMILGIVLCVAGIGDLGLLPLLRSRATSEDQKRLLTIAMGSGALVMIVLGALILTRVIPIGS